MVHWIKKMLRPWVKTTEVRFCTSRKSTLLFCVCCSNCVKALIKLKRETIIAWFCQDFGIWYNPKIPYFTALINCMLYILLQTWLGKNITWYYGTKRSRLELYAANVFTYLINSSWIIVHCSIFVLNICCTILQ